MNNSVITVIGKDRVGIVYDVSKILAENQINILNISQQLMDDFFYHDYFGGHFKMHQIGVKRFWICLRKRAKNSRLISVCKTKKFSKPCTVFKSEGEP